MYTTLSGFYHEAYREVRTGDSTDSLRSRRAHFAAQQSSNSVHCTPMNPYWKQVPSSLVMDPETRLEARRADAAIYAVSDELDTTVETRADTP